MDEKRGQFIVIDGLDGIGKGEIERALIEFEQKLGRTVFDSVAFSKANRKGLAEFSDFWRPPEVYYDTIVTAEPAHVGVGKIIRDEIIARNSRNYPWQIQVEAYSLDRLINMKRIVIPALRQGLRVIQARSLASTLNYQTLKAQEKREKEKKVWELILKHDGNKAQLKWAPDLLIIPTIKDISSLIKRLKEREAMKKEDNAIFENADFQSKLKPLYESKKLRELFEKHGTRVEYLDAGISIESSRKQAVEIYKKFLKDKGLL
jgi:thymidylate kinase